MNSVVCYKWVKEEEDIKVGPNGIIDCSRARAKISDYDRNAIEACREIAQDTGCKAVGVTFGGKDIAKAHANALARGLDESVGIADDALAEVADAYVTANVLAAAICSLGEYNVVICAEGAADTYAHQVGPRIGALLDIPVVTEVMDFKVDQEKLTLTRYIERNIETVEVDMPAMIVLLPEARSAPIPGLKAVLAAKKKPAKELQLAQVGLGAGELTPKSHVVSRGAYVSNRKNIVFGVGDVEERVNQLIEALKEEGAI